MEYWNIGIMG